MTTRSAGDLVPLASRRLAARARDEIMLWTTRDGREIPVEEMGDDHVRNALAALARWRTRIRRQPGQDDTLAAIEHAIALFRRVLRRRAKADPKARTSSRRGSSFSSR